MRSVSSGVKKAAAVTLNLNPVMNGKTLLAELVVENKTPEKIYELQTDISDVLSNQLGTPEKPALAKPFQTRLTGTDGVVKVISNTEKLSVLNPGETFSIVYRISGLDNPYFFKSLRAIESSLESESSGDVTVQIAPVRLVNVNDPFYGIQFDKEKDFLFLVKNKAGEEIKGQKSAFRCWQTAQPLPLPVRPMNAADWSFRAAMPVHPVSSRSPRKAISRIRKCSIPSR